jgi:hypothetical protein
MVYLIEHYYADGSLRDSVEFKNIKATQQWVGEMLSYISENQTDMSLRVSYKEVENG